MYSYQFIFAAVMHFAFYARSHLFIVRRLTLGLMPVSNACVSHAWTRARALDHAFDIFENSFWFLVVISVQKFKNWSNGKFDWNPNWHKICCHAIASSRELLQSEQKRAKIHYYFFIINIVCITPKNHAKHRAEFIFIAQMEHLFHVFNCSFSFRWTSWRALANWKHFVEVFHSIMTWQSELLQSTVVGVVRISNYCEYRKVSVVLPIWIAYV